MYAITKKKISLNVILFKGYTYDFKELAKTDSSGKYDDMLDELVGGDCADLIGSALSGDMGDLAFGLILTGVKTAVNSAKTAGKK